LCPNDVFKVPLIFPGPLLQEVFIIELKVTWTCKSNHQNTPTNYVTSKKSKRLGTSPTRPFLIDAGVNMFENALSKEAEQVIYRSFQSGVGQMILISTNAQNSSYSIDLSTRFSKSLFPTVGIHPNQTEKSTEEDWNIILELAKREDVVAIGECGLDFIENKEETYSKQEQWLERQLELAAKLKKPIFLHERKAHSRFVEIIKKYLNQIPAILVNCFTGTEEELDHYIKLNLYIGITGIICNDDRGVHLRDLVKKIPLDRLIIGSDSPYLTPFTMSKPFPKNNEPQFLPHVVMMLSQCLNISVEEVSNFALRNTREFFKLPIVEYDGTPPSEVFNPISSNIELIKTKPEKKKPEEIKNENTFHFNGKIYSVSEKEKDILIKQQKILSPELFEQLFPDFDLKEKIDEIKNTDKPFH